MVATRWFFSRPTLHLSCRNLHGINHRTPPRKGNCPQHHPQTNHTPRRRSLRPRLSLPPQGICLGLQVGPLDRYLPRRRPQHPRPLDDLHGPSLLVHLGRENRRRPRAQHLRSPHRRHRSRHAHTAALDHPPPALPLLASRVLHQRRPHFP